MFEKLKNIIEKVIDMKLQDVENNMLDDMTGERKTEHDAAVKKIRELTSKLEKALTKEQSKILSEIFDEEANLSGIEQRYMFNCGVKMGLNDLSFIKEELGANIGLL